MIESIITIGKVLGIPGVVILCWYLLEVRKGDREKANDARKAEIDKERIEAENKRTEAMQEASDRVDDRTGARRIRRSLRRARPAGAATVRPAGLAPGHGRMDEWAPGVGHCRRGDPVPERVEPGPLRGHDPAPATDPP